MPRGFARSLQDCYEWPRFPAPDSPINSTRRMAKVAVNAWVALFAILAMTYYFWSGWNSLSPFDKSATKRALATNLLQRALDGTKNAPQEAEDSYRQAAMVFHSLATDFPREQALRQNESVCLGNQGALLMRRNEFADAEKCLRQAVEIGAALVREAPPFL